MGEKGIAADVAGVASGAGASIIERTTTHVTSSVIGLGEEAAESIRSKVVEVAADNAIAEARERLRKEPPADPKT